MIRNLGSFKKDVGGAELGELQCFTQGKCGARCTSQCSKGIARSGRELISAPKEIFGVGHFRSNLLSIVAISKQCPGIKFQKDLVEK